MLLLGLMLLGVSTNPGATVFLWVGMGVALGGAGCFASAWREEQRLQPDAKCDPGMLAMGVAMVLIGAVLIVYGASTNRLGPFTVIWVGMGIVLGGGGCLCAAWQKEEEDTDATEDAFGASPHSATPKSLGTSDIDDVQRQVSGPALGLIIAGCVDLLPVVLGAAAVLLFLSFDSESRPRSVGGGAVPGVSVIGSLVVAQAGAPPLKSLALWPWASIAALALLSTPSGILLIVAGIKMRKAEAYGLAVIASFQALIPCHVGWVIGFPVGIWSLSVLDRPEVKAGFAAHKLKPSQGRMV